MAKFFLFIIPNQNSTAKYLKITTVASDWQRVQNSHPRRKHIAIKYHHFRKHVADKTISIVPIDMKDQLADIFTKPLDRVIFRKLRLILMGW